MASISRRGKRWSVRWREGNRHHSRTCPTQAAARELARQIETNLALGRPALTERPTALPVADAIEAYLLYLRQQGYSGNTRYGHKYIFIVFGEWLLSRSANATMLDLSLGLFDAYGSHLAERGLAIRTRRDYLSAIRQWWQWCAARYPGQVSPCPRPDLPRIPAHQPKTAPTWAEMDLFISAASPTLARLATLLRYTGLRVDEALGLEWADVDLAGGWLVIRPEREKTKRGRRIPLHPDLIRTLGQEPGIAGSVIRLGISLDRATRIAKKIWQECGARPGIIGWHSFRRGWETGLAALGVDLIRIRKLAGHSLGVDDAYLDAAGLDLREAIERIPAVDLAGSQAEVIRIGERKKS